MVPEDAPGLQRRRQALRVKEMFDETRRTLRTDSLSTSERGRMQSKAADEAFKYYPAQPHSEEAKHAARQALMMWGNIGAGLRTRKLAAEARSQRPPPFRRYPPA